MPARSRPTATVESAWNSLLIAHRAILDRLDADLKNAHGVPLEWYDVLHQLARRGGQCTMGELSDALLIGHSRCSRRVDRMEFEELVTRRRDSDDQRVIHATLTGRGRALQKRAAVTHLHGIQAYFGNFLSDGEATRLSHILAAGQEAASRTTDA